MNTIIKNFRWVIISLLFLITVTNYVDRAAISFAISDMTNLFKLSSDEIGFILGGFGIGYAVTTLLGGILVDRYGAKKILVLAIVLWSISLFMTGLAQGFIMAFIARICLGLAEGPNFPGVTRVVGDWLSPLERSRALSIALVAVPVALAISGPIISSVIGASDWRQMFFIIAGFEIIILIVWIWLMRDFPSQSKHVGKEELAYIKSHTTDPSVSEKEIFNQRKNLKNTWRYLLTTPSLLANYFAFFVFGYYLFFFMTWLPTFLEKTYHLTLMKAGLLSSLPWVLATISMILVGIFCDKLYAKTKSLRYSRVIPIVISQLLAGLMIIPIIFAHNIFVATIFISLAVAFSMSTNGCFYAINIDLIQVRAGTALGVMDMVFAIAGFIAPTLTGWLVGVTNNYHIAFLLMAVLSLISIIILLIFHHPDREKIIKI